MSQASPTPSVSLSVWSALGTVGQLSEPVQPEGPALGAPTLQTPSPSESTWASEQPLASTVAPGAVPGQRSLASGTPSPSASAGAGGENSDVLPLPSVAVAVTLGPVTAPGKLQSPRPSATVYP